VNKEDLTDNIRGKGVGSTTTNPLEDSGNKKTVV
jgi:hypothetical protein